MNEARIRQAWQQRQRGAVSRDDALGLFEDNAAAQERAIDAVLEDALAADLARVSLSLRQDAEQLERELSRAQNARRVLTPRRVVSWALAASVLFAAVLMLPRQELAPQPSSSMVEQPSLNSVPDGLIVAGSFESTAGDTPATGLEPNSAQVFAGGFDS